MALLMNSRKAMPRSVQSIAPKSSTQPRSMVRVDVPPSLHITRLTGFRVRPSSISSSRVWKSRRVLPQ